jgi:hypothetical protein
MFELKSLSREAVPRALAKAERYRLLNEPSEAHSICLDVLAVDPDNQEVMATLILALTDQFDQHPALVHEALAAVARLRDGYERAYYTGIIQERRAKALLAHRTPRSGANVYEWLRNAMARYEEADAMRPANNDDARLRWNACARLIAGNPDLTPVSEDPREPLLSE